MSLICKAHGLSDPSSLATVSLVSVGGWQLCVCFIFLYECEVCIYTIKHFKTYKPAKSLVPTDLALSYEWV